MAEQTEFELFRTVPQFGALAPEVLQALASRLTLCKVRRSGNLFTEGELAAGLFVVRTGELKVTKQAHDGREQIFYIARPGKPIVDGIRFDGGVYPASAVALRPSTIWLLSNEVLEAEGTRHPKLFQAVIDLRAKRADRNLSLISEVSLRTVPARLAAFIRTQVALREAQGLDPKSFARVLTTETVAGRLGTVREEVSRGLAMLERVGALRVSPQLIEVLDIDRLEELAYGVSGVSAGRR